jgi:hypothetical protein
MAFNIVRTASASPHSVIPGTAAWGGFIAQSLLSELRFAGTAAFCRPECLLGDIKSVNQKNNR